MVRTLFKLSISAIVMLGVSSVAAESPVYTPGVVTFDELGSSQHISAITPKYEGFTWGNGFVTWSDMGHPSRYTTFQANAGTSISRADGTAFYFEGADFFLRDGAGTNDIYIFLYDQTGALVYNGREEKYGKNHIVDTNRLRTFGAITNVDNAGVAAFYSGQVSAVAFGWDTNGGNAGGNANDFGMDNLRYRAVALASAPPVSPVPEPHTYALLLAGLGFVGAAAKRRKTQNA